MTWLNRSVPHVWQRYEPVANVPSAASSVTAKFPDEHLVESSMTIKMLAYWVWSLRWGTGFSDIPNCMGAHIFSLGAANSLWWTMLRLEPLRRRSTIVGSISALLRFRVPFKFSRPNPFNMTLNFERNILSNRPAIYSRTPLRQSRKFF